MNEPNENEISTNYTVSDAAKMLNVSRVTIYKWLESGKLKNLDFKEVQKLAVQNMLGEVAENVIEILSDLILYKNKLCVVKNGTITIGTVEQLKLYKFSKEEIMKVSAIMNDFEKIKEIKKMVVCHF